MRRSFPLLLVFLAASGSDRPAPTWLEYYFTVDPPPRVGRCDLPAVEGSIFFLNMSVVMVNLVTDIVYAKLDPRVAYD